MPMNRKALAFDVMVWLILGSGLVFIACLFIDLYFQPSQTATSDSHTRFKALLIGRGPLGIVSLPCFYFALRLIIKGFKNTPVMIIDRERIVDNTNMEIKGNIYWRDVQGMCVLGRHVLIEVDSPNQYARQLVRLLGKMKISR